MQNAWMRLCCTTGPLLLSLLCGGWGWGIATATAKGCMHEIMKCGVHRHHKITRVRLARRMMMMMDYLIV
jgi:hypothetical protein